MKWTFLLSAIAFNSLNVQANSLPDKVELATHNLFPYGSYSIPNETTSIADMSFSGLAVDVVRCAFNHLDIELVIHILPWERAQKMVQHDKYDGFFAASKMQKRDEYAVMSSVIAEQKWSWFTLAENSLKPGTTEFFEQAEVASFNGANMHKWLIAHDYKVTASPKNTENLLQMLLKGRVDGALANEKVMLALIEQVKPKPEIAKKVLKNKPLGVYFSKPFISEYPNFLATFNQRVRACRSTTD